MINKLKYFLIPLILFLFVCGGCASLSKNKKALSELEEKVSNLEERTQKIEEGQDRLQKMVSDQTKIQKEILNKLEVLEGKGVGKEVEGIPSNKDIQTALKNAGFYNDEIDGKIGTKTRQAIMEFQEQNGLKVDGVVGKNTWDLLSRFLASEEKD